MEPVFSALPFSAIVFLFLLLSPLCLCQELQEKDALCSPEGCYALYSQRKTFLDSWRSCRDRGGNLVTVKRPEEAALIEELFNMQPHRGTKLRIWIGLQRQPRQCSATRPLRGFTWITGDQDTQYTNWLQEDSVSTCAASRCVVMTYSTAPHEQSQNFKWLDGSCTLPVDGYMCRYNYKGMCTSIEAEGGGPVLYTTPFHLASTLLDHIPFGSVATVPCPDGTKEDQSVLCMQKEDGSISWSKDGPFCTEPAKSECDKDNGGCQHYCVVDGTFYYCECLEGYVLEDDDQTCSPADFCREDPCEFECVSTKDGYLCACPEGYILATNGRDCVDVDECLQSPCEQLCINAPGTFECRCQEGYLLEGGSQCQDIDECQDKPCEHACENTPGSYTCHCHLGYSPSPEDHTQCLDTDECQIPGTCEQMCVNYIGGFECHCEEGYLLNPDGFTCDAEEADWPSTSPATDLLTTAPNLLEWLTDAPSYQWITDIPPAFYDLFTDPPSYLAPDWGSSSELVSEPTQDLWVAQPTPDLTDTAPASPDWSGVAEPTSNWLTETPQVSDWAPASTTMDFWSWLISTTPTAAPEESIRHAGTIQASPGDIGPERASGAESRTGEKLDERETEGYPKPGSVQTDLVPVDPVPTSTEVAQKVRDVGVMEGSIPDSEEDKETRPLEEGGGVRATQDRHQPSPSPAAPLSLSTEGSMISGTRRRQDNNWLLVALLVPLSIFVVVMLALGIVYCTRCALQPQRKSVADCYRWITNSSEPSTSGKSQV
ncbi:endosialin [Huso huso]|uniref:Endosialin n=1 Tax=Huso huso TaxID=61971 RepID=A0ABR0YZG5_HUSHU